MGTIRYLPFLHFEFDMSNYKESARIMRPETGPMQFEDDWRGIFIRGDSALMSYLPMLQILRDKMSDEDKEIFMALGLDGLIELMASANHHKEDESVQMMKKFENCRVIKLMVQQGDS